MFKISEDGRQAVTRARYAIAIVEELRRHWRLEASHDEMQYNARLITALTLIDSPGRDLTGPDIETLFQDTWDEATEAMHNVARAIRMEKSINKVLSDWRENPSAPFMPTIPEGRVN